MALKYTHSLNEFIGYCNEKLEDYIVDKSLNAGQEALTRKRYQEEMHFIYKQAETDSNLTRGLWIAVFLGEMQNRKNIWVRNKIMQCPFVMYLLNLASFNVLEEGYLERKYLYQKTKVAPFDYMVSDNFYESTKAIIAKSFRKSGYTVTWVGGFEPELEKAESKEDRIPVGFAIGKTPVNALEYPEKFGTLYDGEECILEEECWLLEEGELFDDVIYLFNQEMLEGYRDFDIKYSREDLWESLVRRGMSEPEAYYWTEMIRKGQLKRNIQKNRLSSTELKKLRLIVGEESMEYLCEVDYLPNRWSVMDEQYRERMRRRRKIFAVDFDGTLSFGQWPECGKPNEKLIAFLKKRKAQGDKLILWSCREGACLKEAVAWCEEHGLYFDAVNDNLPEVITRYGVNSRKISCDYYIDDRAIAVNAFGLLEG